LDAFRAHKYSLTTEEDVQRSHFSAHRSISGEDIRGYEFDFSSPVTRWALAEVAKTVQHIANISCLPKDEMQVRD
jgi:hypothetical protein